jgi:hypothetical protein
MNVTKCLRTLAIVALVRFCAAVIDDQWLNAFDFNQYISFFYLPAGINVLCMLIFGYEAAIGMVFGSFVFLAYFTSNSPVVNALFCLFTPASAALAYFIITHTKSDRTALNKWHNYSLKDVFFFFVIYSLLNAIIHNIAIAYVVHVSTISLQPIVNKFIGNITGCLTLYLGLSLIMWVILLIQHSRKMRRTI